MFLMNATTLRNDNEKQRSTLKGLRKSNKKHFKNSSPQLHINASTILNRFYPRKLLQQSARAVLGSQTFQAAGNKSASLAVAGVAVAALGASGRKAVDGRGAGGTSRFSDVCGFKHKSCLITLCLMYW